MITRADCQALADVGELASALLAEPGESAAELATYAVRLEWIERHSHVELVVRQALRRRRAG